MKFLMKKIGAYSKIHSTIKCRSIGRPKRTNFAKFKIPKDEKNHLDMGLY